MTKWISIFGLLSMLSVWNCADAQHPFHQHEWEHRLLLLITNSVENKDYQEQVNQFENDLGGLNDRNIIVYTITPKYYQSVDFSDDENRTYKQSGKLYQKLHQQNSFEVVLIGYDGGEKIRQSKVLSMPTLFSTIDKMVIRQREMQTNE